MQGDGGTSEQDRRNGSERGGWARGKNDAETQAFFKQTYQRAGPDLGRHRRGQLP